MKLVFDLQGAQSTNRHRPIGRYSQAMAEAMVRRAGTHEIWIALNATFPDAVGATRAAFSTLLPQERIVTWTAPTPVAYNDPVNTWRRNTGEILREAFIASLKPDMVHVSSLFEGAVDNALTSIGSLTDGQRTAVTLHSESAITKLHSSLGYQGSGAFQQRKLASLRRAGLWLTTSDASRQEAIDYLQLPADKVVNISVAADTVFRPITLSEEETRALSQRYGLTRSFVMCTATAASQEGLLEGIFKAYAELPSIVKRDYQLLLVSSQDEVDALRREALRWSLGSDDFAIAASVSNSDLVALYNLCTAYCLASTGEGHSLCALEAMQCGVATIGVNTSSVRQLIGREDALFPAGDEKEIAASLHKVLTNEAFRLSLAEGGLKQASTFSWDECARRAWAAFEDHDNTREQVQTYQVKAAPDERPRLAYLSPLPPERSGISDYSAELLPELARHYDIDVIVDQHEINDAWITANCAVRDLNWFRQNARNYDRILYHFGNSPFHKHMFELLELHPGVVMLHDFFLSGVLAHQELHSGWVGFWTRALYYSHGFGALYERAQAAHPTELMWKYPANFPVLQSAQGIIVHSDHSRQLARQFYGPHVSDDWAVVRFLRRLPHVRDRKAARAALGIGERDFVICSFGIMNPTKLNHRLLNAWVGSGLSKDANCYLIFVGQEDKGEYGAELRRMISNASGAERIRITGFAAPELYQQYLIAADAAVQLRTQSRGETSAAVFDCMSYALPTIVNAHGSMAELPADHTIILSDDFEDAQLAVEIEALRANPERRRMLGEQAQSYVRSNHSPRSVADQYHAAIENFVHQSIETVRKRALTALLDVEAPQQDEQEWVALSRAFDLNLPWRQPQRQLLVDVSANVVTDLKTGIERVVRAQILELLHNPPSGFRVEPVYLVQTKNGWEYRYARRYTAKLLSLDGGALEDAAVNAASGDIFYSPDYHPSAVTLAAKDGIYADWRARGVEINFLVYDLLPVLRPEFFPGHSDETHARWIGAIAANADQLICISQAVADDLSSWLAQQGEQLCAGSGPAIIALHLGADISAATLSMGMQDDAEDILARIGAIPSFLMVGTIEPRKGHLQTLAAFEQLWLEGIEANLVIVGAEGWKGVPHEQRRTLPEIVDKLHNHPEQGRRLFWLKGVSDEYLERIYAASACLIAASEGEGFGLPLIEAARHNIPILARGIPVFREVAGEYASYFNGSGSGDLVDAIKRWLLLFAEARHPRSEGMPWLTWAESVEQLKNILLKKDLHQAKIAAGCPFSQQTKIGASMQLIEKAEAHS